ncbi:ketose-bisphosphate aldolase [Nakamurella flavida]
MSDYGMLNAVFEVSTALSAPIMIAIHPLEVALVGEEFVAAVVAKAHKAPVPVAVHLDHGATYEEVANAIRTGFTSVMIDASHEPFEENIRVTQEVTRLAHAAGISVEAELGTIGATDGYAEAGSDDIIYTDPDMAAHFVQATGVDSLAVAIGTRHGLYPATLRAALRIDLLEKIAQRVDVPLVLHGGSDNPDAEISQAVAHGVAKVNISSDIKSRYYDTMREVLQDKGLREPHAIVPACSQALQDVAAHKIRLLGAEGAAAHFQQLASALS